MTEIGPSLGRPSSWESNPFLWCLIFEKNIERNRKWFAFFLSAWAALLLAKMKPTIIIIIRLWELFLSRWTVNVIKVSRFEVLSKRILDPNRSELSSRKISLILTRCTWPLYETRTVVEANLGSRKHSWWRSDTHKDRIKRFVTESLTHFIF